MNIELITTITIYVIAFALFIKASMTDYQKREISNRLNLAIAGLGIALHLIMGEYSSLTIGIIFASIMYGAGYLAYRAGIVGGGDVKMWSAGSIFFGAQATIFIQYMALYGFVLAIVAIFAARRAKKLGLILVNSDDAPMPKNFLHNLGCPEVPYGFAITAAGLTLGIQNIFILFGGQ